MEIITPQHLQYITHECYIMYMRYTILQLFYKMSYFFYFTNYQNIINFF